MKFISDNKAFFMFLLRFAGCYLALAGIYWLYLSQYTTPTPDGITTAVAHQTLWGIQFLGEQTYMTPHLTNPSWIFYINNERIMQIIEGCNAVSVMILFAAFVVAFYTRFKQVMLFTVAGIAIIHILNIVRITLLGVAGYHYHQYWHFLHDIVFPLFIYGVVFFLWVIWVTKFYSNAKKTNP
ncbi:exosortase family protein XrtF [Flavobacterium sp. RHBU_3]|uniref:exosortase family protein XrtF n=1 Tax=Flavobacterium sp. RHBU_3 TaxID=3391184 RepID=UPI0039850ED2